MRHEDQETFRIARTRVPDARGRRPVPTAHRIVAGLGLALTVAVGAATVTVTLREADARATTSTPVTTPVTPDPRLLRLWGLRVAPDGVLVPVATTDTVTRTVLEQRYADLLRPPGR